MALIHKGIISIQPGGVFVHKTVVTGIIRGDFNISAGVEYDQ